MQGNPIFAFLHQNYGSYKELYGLAKFITMLEVDDEIVSFIGHYLNRTYSGFTNQRKPPDNALPKKQIEAWKYIAATKADECRKALRRYHHDIQRVWSD